jgi:hypothetical protein
MGEYSARPAPDFSTAKACLGEREDHGLRAHLRTPLLQEDRGYVSTRRVCGKVQRIMGFATGSRALAFIIPWAR